MQLEKTIMDKPALQQLEIELDANYWDFGWVYTVERFLLCDLPPQNQVLR